MRIDDYTSLWAIVLAVAGTTLIVGMVMTTYRRVGGRRRRTSTRIDVRVGRFSVMAGGASRHAGGMDGCAASAFTGHRDALLSATVGEIAVMAETSGAASSQSVSVAATETFLQWVRRSVPTATSVTELLHDALLRANAQLVLVANEWRQSARAFAAVAITPSGLCWVSLGDARIYLVRAGVVWRVNREPAVAVESAGASLRPFTGIDTAPAALPLHAGDHVLICNAGLHSRIAEGAMAESIARYGPDCSRALVDGASTLDATATLSAIHLGIRDSRRTWLPLRVFSVRGIDS